MKIHLYQCPPSLATLVQAKVKGCHSALSSPSSPVAPAAAPAFYASLTKALTQNQLSHWEGSTRVPFLPLQGSIDICIRGTRAAEGRCLSWQILLDVTHSSPTPKSHSPSLDP